MALNRRDPEEIRLTLLPWLRARIPDADEIMLSLPAVPASGGSGETFFIEATIHANGMQRRESWVLRIEATTYQVYERPSIARQFLTMQKLGERGSMPVPKTLWHEEDKGILGETFFLMERVAGTVPRDLFHTDGLFADAAPAEREAMWLSGVEAMAAIHGVDAGDFAFLDRPGLGSTALEQEMAVWDSYSRWSSVRPHPAQERARIWLADHMPAVKPHGLSWGDARLGNTIYKDQVCVAILDWETVSLSGAETDLGWWLFYDWFASDGQGVPRLEGIPMAAATLQYWEQLIGRKANDIDWYVVFATWRFSMIRDHAVHMARTLGLMDIPVPEPDPMFVYLAKLTGG